MTRPLDEEEGAATTPVNGVSPTHRAHGLRAEIAAKLDVRDMIADEALEHVEMLSAVESFPREVAVRHVISGLRNAMLMLEAEGEEARREERRKAWTRSEELIKPYDAHVEGCKSCEPTKRPKSVHCDEGAVLLAKMRDG